MEEVATDNVLVSIEGDGRLFFCPAIRYLVLRNGDLLALLALVAAIISGFPG